MVEPFIIFHETNQGHKLVFVNIVAFFDPLIKHWYDGGPRISYGFNSSA
ncbi:hypothetical protein OIU79_024390 [Salix purpurea]|uniref:Uncharacterized protein n=1 Tax=Salix purpurea TaxID=77065 RepID=A0A9Q0WAR8_SALPP|nr:hypothetical protein OIU79_024390 [Salix purpurea]